MKRKPIDAVNNTSDFFLLKGRVLDVFIKFMFLENRVINHLEP